MNCHEVSKQLSVYLDEEVSPSEKKLIQAHLRTCKICQQELEDLGSLQEDIRQHLQSRVMNAAPSPQAWATLQASLPTTPPSHSNLGTALRSNSLSRALSMRSFSIQRIGIILLVLVVLVAVAPPVWARIQPIITNWFSFSSPNGESKAAIGGFSAFNPLHATYLPEGFEQSLLGSMTSIEPEIESLEIGYNSKDQFILLVQSKGPGVTELPSGETSSVNGLLAVFIPSFATNREDLIERRPEISTVTNYSYETTNLLAWFMEEVKVELFSNLPLEEILKVAESLEPMQASEGEVPIP